MNNRYTNRGLSLLDFQDRVLAMAEDRSLPLLERIDYTAIVSNNVALARARQLPGRV